jgi:hypothetical protein
MAMRSVQRAASILLASALVLGASGSSIGVESVDGDESGEPDAVQSVRTEPGKALKIGGVKVADSWLVLTDPRNDFLREDGSRSTETDPKADIVELWVTVGDVNKKLLQAIRGGMLQFGRPGNWVGANFNSQAGDEALFVAVKPARKATAKTASNVQVVVTFDGNDAVADRAGPAAGVYTGSETSSMGGGFDGAWRSGDSTLKGHVDGAIASLFNTPRSRGVGGVDKASGSMIHITPIPGDAETFTVMSRTGSGTMYDQADLPGGGTHIGLPGTPWRFNVGKSATDQPRYTCQRIDMYEPMIDTAASESSPPHPFRLESTFELEDPVEFSDTVTFPLRLFPVGSDADPTVVDGMVELLPGFGGMRFSAYVPEGHWQLERIDLRSGYPTFLDSTDPPRFGPLFGNAGLLVGPGLSGHTAGNAGCATWHLPDELCDLFPNPDMGQAMAIAAELEHGAQHIADGTLLCFGVDPETREPAYIASLGDDYYTNDNLFRDAERHRCPYTEVPIGAGGVLFDCSAEGFKSFMWVVPAGLGEFHDSQGGLRASLDFDFRPGDGQPGDDTALRALLEEVNGDFSRLVIPFDWQGPL